jgi:hypothetical protein
MVTPISPPSFFVLILPASQMIVLAQMASMLP